MSLLESFPHTCTTKRRTRTKDSVGGAIDTPITISEDLACWQQPATDAEVTEFAKRGIEVTNKVYFTADPGVDTKYILEITNPQTGRTDTLEVMSRARPDASAGLGLVYRVMAKQSTTGSTP